MTAARLLPALLVALAVAVGGCGSSDEEGGGGGTDRADTKTFDAEGFEISFSYPADMKEADDVTVDQSAGAEAKATAGVGYDERNGIFVQRYDLNRAIGKGDLAEIKPEVDMLFEQGFGQPADGKPSEFGGLPALEYEFDVMGQPDERSRFLVIFDGDTEYTLNCQSNKERRDDIEKACDTALETVKKS